MSSGQWPHVRHNSVDSGLRDAIIRMRNGELLVGAESLAEAGDPKNLIWIMPA